MGYDHSHIMKDLVQLDAITIQKKMHQNKPIIMLIHYIKSTIIIKHNYYRVSCVYHVRVRVRVGWREILCVYHVRVRVRVRVGWSEIL